ELLRRDDLLDEPPALGLLGRDRLARDVEEERALRADEARQPLRPAGAGDEAELDLPLAELRVRGRDAHVARPRQLEPPPPAPAAEAPAADRRDDALRARLDLL